LIIDNYDSFVNNLARYVREAGWETKVMRHDEVATEDFIAMAPAGVIISPGPKTPTEAAGSMQLLSALDPRVPLLGVCLGHQALVESFGGVTQRSRFPLHGEASEIRHTGRGLFRGLPSPMMAGRYHSLIAIPDCNGPLRETAWSTEGEVMAVVHQERPWCGVQFHPESLLTPHGRGLVQNFLSHCRAE
ncbi:MAG: aminodeoxychorismate/anthranilate synthase component II, partial [Pseudomonadota bacterium]